MASWTSEVAVCNGALGLLGAERITSIDPNTDGSTEADLCAQYFSTARDATLRAYPWNFSIARADLGAPLASSDPRAPLYEWLYGFVLPRTNDNWCLRVLETKDRIDYRVEGETLVCNDASVQIKYIRRVTALSLWDDQAKLALAAHLAMMLAMPITKSASVMQAMGQMYQLRIDEGYNTDTQEGTPEEIDSDEVLNARF